MKKTNITKLAKAIKASKPRSAWEKGMQAYAVEFTERLLENIECGYFEDEDIKAPKILEKELLNGASDWREYSWGGCSLIYDCEIAERLSTPTELKITRNGARKPNSREEWLDVQARALYQAAEMVKNLAKAI